MALKGRHELRGRQEGREMRDGGGLPQGNCSFVRASVVQPDTVTLPGVCGVYTHTHTHTRPH